MLKSARRTATSYKTKLQPSRATICDRQKQVVCNKSHKHGKEYKSRKQSEEPPTGKEYSNAFVALTEFLFGVAICAETADPATRNILDSSEPDCLIWNPGQASLDFEQMLGVVGRINDILKDEDFPVGRLPDAHVLCRQLEFACQELRVLASLAGEGPNLSAKQVKALQGVRLNACTFGEVATALSRIAYLRFEDYLRRITLAHSQWLLWEQEGVLGSSLFDKAAPSYQKAHPLPLTSAAVFED